MTIEQRLWAEVYDYLAVLRIPDEAAAYWELEDALEFIKYHRRIGTRRFKPLRLIKGGSDEVSI